MYSYERLLEVDSLLSALIGLDLGVYLGVLLEAAGGFEPPYNGFADRRLTTWLSRHPTFYSLREFHSAVKACVSEFSVVASRNCKAIQG